MTEKAARMVAWCEVATRIGAGHPWSIVERWSPEAVAYCGVPPEDAPRLIREEWVRANRWPRAWWIRLVADIRQRWYRLATDVQLGWWDWQDHRRGRG